MTNHLNPKAIAKANAAAEHLRKAAALMDEAVALSDNCIASGRYDFMAWADQISQMLSCDNGEAGILPTLQKFNAAIPKPKTYPHRRSDGRVVNVTIPEKE